FFSFVPTNYTGVSELGEIAGVGMLLALALNLTLLPALLTILRPRGERRPVGFARAAPIDRFLVVHRRPLLALTALVPLGSLAVRPWPSRRWWRWAAWRSCPSSTSTSILSISRTRAKRRSRRCSI